MKVVIYIHFIDENDPVHGFVKVNNLQAYADRKGFDVIRVFTENTSEEKAPFQLLDRPILHDCVSFCLQERPDVLLVSRLSDLGAFTYDIIRTVDALSNSGISIYIEDLDVVTIKADGTPDWAGTLMKKVLENAFFIDYEYYRARRNAGRERHKIAGGRLGRPNGTVMPPEQKLEKFHGVSLRLDEDECATIDEIAAEEELSSSTVKKPKKILWMTQLGDCVRKDMQTFYEEMAIEKRDDE